MTRRIRVTDKQRRRLLAANADRCCVCKRNEVGFHLHHIDGDSSNTIDGNLAVLCIEDHDRHHRPKAYRSRVNHLELDAERILKYKMSWEKFVSACHVPGSPVLATVTMFGTKEEVHSTQVVYQWKDETIEHTHSFHLLEGGYEQWADDIVKEVESIGPHLIIAMIEEPQPVEHCPCCGTGFSHTTKTALLVKLTDKRWSTHSIMSIFINPEQPSLAMSLGFGEEHLYSGSLHVCQSKFLHYTCDYDEERIRLKKKPSIRTQATRMVEKIINKWSPAVLVIGTGNHDSPEIIEELNLPLCWERRAATKSQKPTR